MDTSGFPVPDAIHPLLEQLQEALVLEVKYQPNLQLLTTTQNDEITIARPKHMACISVSAFHIAAVQMAQSLDADHLVSISQCKCTGGDLKRMSGVIRNKLEWAPAIQPITSLTFLQLFNTMFHTVASHLGIGDIYANVVMESELFLRLEMIACDGNCASLRSSEIALVLLCTYLDAAVKRLDANKDVTISVTSMAGPSTINSSVTPAHQMLRLVEFAAEVQKICKISGDSFVSTHEAVSAVLNKYNAQEQTPHRQRLIWRLSSRTARLLRPTDKFTSVLPVIAEHTPVPSPKKTVSSPVVMETRGVSISRLYSTMSKKDLSYLDEFEFKIAFSNTIFNNRHGIDLACYLEMENHSM
ncbi:hypothetical protein HZH68_002065 [Vespula germanica]|uniref:Uncharacterized protein n=1 Tax=Vespula germanica TaxID=30212 RepID=A0A834KX90_VESGE|nr:hypothetical protein HZH68_002065 [Vespula germanica]